MRSRLLVQRLQRMREYAGYAAVTGNLSSLSLSRRSATVLCRYLAVGSCAKHLTVESYMVIYAVNSHTFYY